MLELRNINKGFGEKQILSNFSLSIPEKQILAIVGPSGGGKTTLLRMLAGLEIIDSGQIFYNGCTGEAKSTGICLPRFSTFPSFISSR